MTKPQKNNNSPEHPMSVMDAIYNRHAIRDYLPQKIEKNIINELLDAAVHAPTAMHEEPWSFVIIQNKNTLDRLSEATKTLIHSDTEQSKHALDIVNQTNFNVFYNANTLIVIYSQFQGPVVGEL